MKSLIPFSILPVNILVVIGAVVIVVFMVVAVVVVGLAVRSAGSDLTPCLLLYVAQAITKIALS